MSLGEKDKYAIKGMVTDGMSVDDIAKFLKKTKLTEEIQKYVDSISIAVEESPTEEDEKIADLLSQLKTLGVDPENLVEIISELKNVKDKEVGELKNEIVEKSKAMSLINTKSQNGRSGVAVMTQPASERADDFAKISGRHKKTPDYIFKPRG